MVMCFFFLDKNTFLHQGCQHKQPSVKSVYFLETLQDQGCNPSPLQTAQRFHPGSC